MIHRPKVLILDEPASGLDPKARIELRNLLRATRDAGATILISSHILTELEGLCTSIGIMEKGRLVRSGKIEDVVSAGAQSRHIKLQWLGDSAQQLQDFLSAIPAVTEIKVNTTEADFNFSGSEEDQAQLLGQLIARGIRITTFREVRQTVEEMYMKLSTHEVM
jgi:ABC-2 type transport system ATP-binding protein